MLWHADPRRTRARLLEISRASPGRSRVAAGRPALGVSARFAIAGAETVAASARATRSDHRREVAVARVADLPSSSRPRAARSSSRTPTRAGSTRCSNTCSGARSRRRSGRAWPGWTCARSAKFDGGLTCRAGDAVPPTTCSPSSAGAGAVSPAEDSNPTASERARPPRRRAAGDRVRVGGAVPEQAAGQGLRGGRVVYGATPPSSR